MNKYALETEYEGISLDTMDWNAQYITDKYTGVGFDVTEPIYSKGSTEINKYGIQSPLFGTRWDDSGENKNINDIDISKTAWISLHGYCVIHPIYYHKLISLMSEKTLLEIINRPEEIDRYGNLVYNSKNKWAGIGMMSFRDNFYEILDSYKNIKQKKSVYEDIYFNRHKVFVSYIPLYTSVARPTVKKNGKYTYNTIDKIYSPIFSMSRLLKDDYYKSSTRKKRVSRDTKMEVTDILAKIQATLLKGWEVICEDISHKDGQIKWNILGGNIGFCSRDVIIPNSSLRADQVILNYHAMLELYRYEIISILAYTGNINPYEAKKEWFKARISFNPKVHAIMKQILRNGDNKIIINRPPTINRGSLMAMQIVDISDGFDGNFTMSIPLWILNAMNADFDGDALLVTRLVEETIKDAYWKGFNPRKNMYLSKDHGEFNEEFMLIKEQLVGLYEFANI